MTTGHVDKSVGSVTYTLPAELSGPGRALQIGCFDRRVPAVVAREPLCDPEMKRMRG